MKKLRIALDFDGVIGDTSKLKHQVIKEMYGIEGVNPSRFKEQAITEDGILTREEYRQLMRRICGEYECGIKMNPVGEVGIYLPKLINDRHQIAVVTAREGPEVAVADAWCKARGLDLVFVSSGYASSKIPYLRGFDVCLDDDLDHLRELVGVVPNLYLYSWGYNESFEAPTGIKRINSWRDFYRDISILAKI